MSVSPPFSARFRVVVAVIMLVAVVVFMAVTLSALLVGGETDPRDTIGSRAAGFGFTDSAHQMLFSGIPLVLPLAAALLTDHLGVWFVAVIEYGLIIVLEVTIAVAAFLFGMDMAAQQEYTAGVVFIDSRAAVERLILDVTVIVLTASALAATVVLWRRSGAPARAA